MPHFEVAKTATSVLCTARSLRRCSDARIEAVLQGVFAICSYLLRHFDDGWIDQESYKVSWECKFRRRGSLGKNGRRQVESFYTSVLSHCCTGALSQIIFCEITWVLPHGPWVTFPRRNPPKLQLQVRPHWRTSSYSFFDQRTSSRGLLMTG